MSALSNHKMLPNELLRGIQFSTENGKYLQQLEQTDFQGVLTAEWVQGIFESCAADEAWARSIEECLQARFQKQQENEESRQFSILFLGLSALYAFLQANVTGPPLSWNPAKVIIKGQPGPGFRRGIVASLSSDGVAAYHLTPHIELFKVAQVALNASHLPREQAVFAWARLSVNFWHQQLLNETSPILQSLTEQDLQYLDVAVLGKTATFSADTQVLYLLEKASIKIFHGQDKEARNDLQKAVKLREFEYTLTGRLGRRTKFQQFDISQLVVLAKSANKHGGDEQSQSQLKTVKPDTLELNDDTILESISFTKEEPNGAAEEAPTSLTMLDAANQPVLDTLDSIILLSVASSITNTSPQHGLTREETLPYATRVLDDGSTNWQLYTQALLVRSRIEGYKSRTVERGVLQLQALVDQVIAETSGSSYDISADATTFLPRPKPSESASPAERLLYIDQLGSPLRWTLEAELASRWASLGSLRTALEIFQRLEMWAEAALCLAATDKEDKARQMIRRQIYEPSGTSPVDDGIEQYLGKEFEVLPADAPRLFCILGDLEQEPKHYERAWEVSNQRFARAQRSLGKHYVAVNERQKADKAYVKSLVINPQNAGTWFSLGCVRLETQDWTGAVEAFTRMVSLEQDDAEAWSNLAAALLRLPPEKDVLDADGEVLKKGDPQKHTKEAFVALKRATSLKRESYRIWQNLLNVAATLVPPPYLDLIAAQQRLIELRADTDGEDCIDVEVLEYVLSRIIADRSGNPSQIRTKYGMENMFTLLVWKQVMPLITHSRRLWQFIARLAIFEGRSATALDAYEKAWRTTLNTPGWDDGAGSSSSATTSQAITPEKAWTEVVSSTLELIDAYESLGEKEISEGLGAGSGELVCKNWKYKARMAIRSVIGRRNKAGFDDVDELKSRAEDFKR